MADGANPPTPYSESDTRQQLIDRQLALAGWNVRDPSQVLQELDIVIAEGKPGAVSERSKGPYDGHQFADYGLMIRGRPAAVVEAKKTSRDAEVGQEQARQYAVHLNRIYPGSDPFVMYSNGHKTFFWETGQYPPARVFGFPSPLDLEWMQDRRRERRALSVELINTGIAGRDYQIEAIRTVLDGIEAARRKFLLVMATGTGKTRVAAALIDVLNRGRWVKRTLFLVDRIPLRDQALDAFKEHLPAEPRWSSNEGKFVRDRRIYVATYPTMLNLIEGGTTPDRWISPFFFDLIVADESHRSIYNIYKQVIEYFHGLTLGLTATPRDQVSHDTFHLFDCPTGEPTFVYSFEEAVNHKPPYLVPFEALKLKTRFQVEGIRGPKLDENEQEQLELQGFDPERVDWEGTDLEKKVTNSGTNAQIVREFMEESIKDPSGMLPGKSIVFACSVAHARRLQDLFDRLYPEHKGRLAKVMVSDDSRVHGKGGLLDQFKNHDMPRVAISVDMLDTGVDILEVVNLVFAKPVYSLVKFWQMIGRGTRVLDADPAQRKPWCTAKDRFLILDCWGNFEYFDMHPKGREPGSQVPLPVRLFRARLDQLAAALAFKSPVSGGVAKRLRADLAALPAQNVVVMEAQAQLARARSDAFWVKLDEASIAYLRDTIAPVLRAQTGLDAKALRFEIDVTDFGTALVQGNDQAMATLRDSIVEQVAGLPATNLVAREQALISQVVDGSWWTGVDQAKLDDLVARLGPLMYLRREDAGPLVQISLADVTLVHERISSGTGGADLAVSEYRRKVEETVRQLLADNEVLQRLQAGEPVSDADLRALAELLRKQDPAIDEDRLRKAYDVRSASFEKLIRQVLGVETIERWSTMVSRAFEEFIASHTTYSARQIRFLQTLRTFVLQRRRLERKDLVEAPFTQVDPKGIRGVFPAPQIEEVIEFANRLVA